MRNPIKAMAALLAMLLGPTSALAQSAISTQPVQQSERAMFAPTSQMIENGRSIAASTCAECHGLDGLKADPGTPFLAGQRAVYLYRVMRAFQNPGTQRSTMQHAGEFLNNQALLDVSAYYASLSPARKPAQATAAEQQRPPADDPFAGIRDTLRKCTKCHGETGNSKASGMPNLTAQDPVYFDSAMQAYIDGNREHRIMQRLAAGLDAETVRQLGIFFAVQEPARSETAGEGNPQAGGALADKCASCHGADGNAESAKVPSLAGQDARYFVKAMEEYREGERKHDSMIKEAGSLSEQQTADLAAFYTSQEPQRRQVRRPFTVAEWIDRCQRCHGLGGNSTDPRFPMLAGQEASYLRKVLKAYAEGGNGASTMHAMASPLTTSDIDQLADFYSAQEPKAVVYLQLPCTGSNED